MDGSKQYLLYAPYPALATIHDLSKATHLSPGLLYRLSTRSSWHYRVHYIPKPTGDAREIAEPSRPLKAVQSWILANILRDLALPTQAIGFRRGFSILDNASAHEHNKYLLSLDIDGFFPSIRYGWVYMVFRSLGYNEHICHVLTSLCTFNGRLPQGGVTSPALSNLVSVRMDRRTSDYCGPRNIAYTRYADDMTFSSMNANRLVGLYAKVRQIVESEGFTLNEAKTRFMGPKRRRKVTGLVIGEGRAGIGRQAERRFRAAVYSLMSRPQPAGIGHDVASLRGYLCFMKSVDRERYTRMVGYIGKLSSRFDRLDLRRGLLGRSGES